MTVEWNDLAPSDVRDHYDSIASRYPLYERLFCVPPLVRRTAVAFLGLRPGQRVLEIGCGRGKNIKLLREAVGERGHVYGLDISKGMLDAARSLAARRRWRNVSFAESDAAEYTGMFPPHGVLMCLSYNVMPHRREVLARAWKNLAPGGSLVIADGKPPSGMFFKELLLPSFERLVRRTVLGNPNVRAWEDIVAYDSNFRMEEFLFGSYFVVRAVKPL